MANEHVNHLVINGVTKLDLRSDTVTPSALAEGYTAHDRSGAPITGTATGPELQAKTATPSTSRQVITADSGYEGLSQVTVSAMPSGSATTPTTSITANPSISVNSSTGLITASVSGSKSVTPSVSAGYVSSGTAGTVSVSGSNTSQLTTQAAKTVTPSTSSQTAVAAGRYTTGAVTVAAMPSGTAGTPTATKGTVSNHAISVTPSVTNTTGYITGGTKSGTAVTVSASELVSGTQTITENGTVDVTNLASVDVDVESSGGNIVTGTFTFDEAGTKSVSIPYTGSGYPVLIDICVTNFNENQDWIDLIRRYAIEHIVFTKYNWWSSTPTYGTDGDENAFIGGAKYKSSDSDGTLYAYSKMSYVNMLTSTQPKTTYVYRVLTMPNATTMRVLINHSNYTFVQGIEYTYRIVYSE